MSRRFRSLYGAGPVNLLVLLLCFAIAGFAVAGWFQRPHDVETIIEWFIAAVLLHDLVAVPLYTLLDRILLGWMRRPAAGGRPRAVLGVVNSTPYLRVPALLSGLLFIVFFPVIFGLGRQSELNASGIAESGYLARWLIASGVMFALSGVAWGVLVRARVRGVSSHSAGSGGAGGAGPAQQPVPAPVHDAPPAPVPPAQAVTPTPHDVRPPAPPDDAAVAPPEPSTGDETGSPPSAETTPSDDVGLPPAPD